MTRSMPLPGPSNPQVNRVGRPARLPAATVGVVDPCGIVEILPRSTSNTARSTVAADSDITTTESANRITDSSTDR